MAKKTDQKAPAAAEAAAATTAPAAAPAAAKPAAPKTVDTFVGKNPVKEGDKLAPQARVIVNVLHAQPNARATRDELCKALEGKLTTRQPIGRIVTYYQKMLTEKGHLVIETAPVA